MGEGRPSTRHTPLMLATLAKCPRRYEIEFVNNYRLKGRRPAPWPPSVKSLVREALRERDAAQARGARPLRARAVAEAIVNVYAEEMHALIGSVPLDVRADLEAEIAAVADEARRILAHYEEVHRGSPLSFVVFDQIAEHRILNSELTLADRVDGVVRITPDKQAALIRRFTSNTNPEEVRADLLHDLALRGQLWSASHLTGNPVTTAVVDVVRTKAPSIPETTQCRKCRGEGKVGAGTPEEKACPECGGTGVGGMSKRACDTTMSVWRSTASAAGLDVQAEEGRCAAFLAKIANRGESFAYRVEVEIGTHELKAWAKDALALAGLAEFHKQQGHWPRNADACVGRSGPCPYRKVCSPTDAGMDVAWFSQVDEAFPGLD